MDSNARKEKFSDLCSISINCRHGQCYLNIPATTGMKLFRLGLSGSADRTSKQTLTCRGWSFAAPEAHVWVLGWISKRHWWQSSGSYHVALTNTSMSHWIPIDSVIIIGKSNTFLFSDMKIIVKPSLSTCCKILQTSRTQIILKPPLGMWYCTMKIQPVKS